VNAVKRAEASLSAFRDTFPKTQLPSAPPTPHASRQPHRPPRLRTDHHQRTSGLRLHQFRLPAGRPCHSLPESSGNPCSSAAIIRPPSRYAGKFGRTDPFSFALWLKPTEKQNRAVVFHASVAWTDSGSRGYEFVLDEGRPFFALIHFWPGNAVAVRAREPLPLDQWSHVTVTYDGSSRADGVRLYVNGEPLAVETVRDHLYKDIKHRSEWGDSDGGGAPLKLAGRFRDNGFKNGFIDEFQVFGTELTALEVVAISRSTEAGRDLPLPPSLAKNGSTWHIAHTLARENAAYRDAQAALRDARIAENQLVNPVREIMVMKELPQPRPTYVLRRGAYDAPTDPSALAFPSASPRSMPVSPGIGSALPAG
jgi:hypothetical protein